jgi:3-phosphoshikimate 1-carboxyvinyltransferase
MQINSTNRFIGEINLPGDKSISHRVAMIAAWAAGRTTITNFARSADCQSTLACLRQLGVPMFTKNQHWEIVGGNWQPPAQTLDAGNSGTTIRLLSGLLAGQPFASEITGDSSLQRRPMRRIIAPLTAMGAEIIGREDGFAPLQIRGRLLQPINYQLPVASAQVKSCLLLAGLTIAGETVIVEPVATRDHTEIMLPQFGADLKITNTSRGREIRLQGGQKLQAVPEYRVVGDISTAAFFIAAAVMLPNAQLIIRDVGVNPTRTAFLDLLQQWGAGITIRNVRSWHGEPVADLEIQSSCLCSTPQNCEIKGAIVANLIDEIPILAILATQMTGGLVIRDAKELRVKESDRIAAIVKNLRAMSVTVTEFPDGLAITGKQTLQGAIVDTLADHRIAMAFSIAGLLATTTTTITDSAVVGVSCPDFFQYLQQLTG